MTFLLTAFAVMTSVLIVAIVILRLLNHKLNVKRLQIWVAVSCGYLITNLFIELLPESLAASQLETRSYFLWSAVGIFSVIAFERYLEPRLGFVEKLFELHTHKIPKNVGIVPGEDDSHHHHHKFSEAEHCDHSHEHSHLHQHTHQDWRGAGAVCSVVACFMTCSFFDGVALASVQSLGSMISVLLLIGVIFHAVPEGILSGVLVLAGGGGIKGAQIAIALIAVSFFAGAIIPTAFHFAEGQFLGISTGILMFVILVQLLPTALKVKLAPAWISLGAGIFFVAHELIELLLLQN